jgi:TatD DNase family protein
LKEQQIALKTDSISKKNINCQSSFIVEAFDEIFEILEEEKAPDLFGIFHCFQELMSRL